MGILSRDIGALQAEMDRKFQEAVGATQAALVLSTPVDTGNARLGWQIEPRGDFYVSVVNRVAYIEELERGHSQQAPDGIIAMAMPMIDASINEIFR